MQTVVSKQLESYRINWGLLREVMDFLENPVSNTRSVGVVEDDIGHGHRTGAQGVRRREVIDR